MIAGISGGTRGGAVALAEEGHLIGVCSQERATRVRGAGVNRTGLPDEALDLLLRRHGRTRRDVHRYVVVDGDVAAPSGLPFEIIDHHLAHACTAYLTSPFSSSVVVICDHDAPDVSVWRAEGAIVRRVDWPWRGPGFAAAYSRFSSALGIGRAASEQQVEALARLHPDSRDPSIDKLIQRGDDGISVDPSLERHLEERLAGAREPAGDKQARMAAALQGRLGEMLLDFLRDVRNHLGMDHLCLGGTLFDHSSINTLVKQSGLFSSVFIPVDPGNSGLAVGAALHALGGPPSLTSPFLGPSYSVHETKDVLDNCKLQYTWEGDEGGVHAAVKALKDGRLVGWFEGPMEWGPRALGGRSILANPGAPYVLENLNRFLKHREPWRGYAVSGPEEAVAAHFDGPATAPFMECDYRPRDLSRFEHALPSPGAAIRVQTVGAGARPLFARLLEAFGEVSGLPFLINTSYNGFHEPIVCTARDALRVFYGTGLDVLVLNQFVLRK